MMAARWRNAGWLRTVAGTVAAIGAGVLLAPVAGLGGCASSASPTAGTGNGTVTSAHMVVGNAAKVPLAYARQGASRAPMLTLGGLPG
jgi:hypothetical protein